MWTYRDRSRVYYDPDDDPNPDRPTRIYHALNQLGIKDTDIAELGKTLSESKLPSIDRLVFHRGEQIAQSARMLISALLLDCEKSEALGNPRSDGDWFSLLWANLTAQRKSIAEVNADKVAIFTFNYDRSVEQLFLAASRATYGVDDEAAAKFVSRIRIEHFYGVTTRLLELSDSGVNFDCEREHLSGAVAKAEKEIWLVDDERKRQLEVFNNAREAVQNTKLVTFLGYGFDEVNDRTLGIADVISHAAVQNKKRKVIMENATRIHRVSSGTIEIDPRVEIPKEIKLPRFQATTLGMYVREVATAIKRLGLIAGPHANQIATLGKNCRDALREWGTFDVLRE